MDKKTVVRQMWKSFKLWKINQKESMAINSQKERSDGYLGYVIYGQTTQITEKNLRKAKYEKTTIILA